MLFYSNWSSARKILERNFDLFSAIYNQQVPQESWIFYGMILLWFEVHTYLFLLMCQTIISRFVFVRLTVVYAEECKASFCRVQ